MRGEVGQILLSEFAKGANQGVRTTDGVGPKSVGLVFEAARPQVDQRGRSEGDRSAEQTKKQERGGQTIGWETKGLLKTGLLS